MLFCFVVLDRVKVNLIKTANNGFLPADEEAIEHAKNLKIGEVYSAEVKLNQNYKLLQKIHVFFKHCAKYYFGSEDVDKYEIEYTKDQLLIASGYYRTLVDPRTGHIEVKAASISYAKMKEEERRDCYQKLVTAACKNVFHSADERTWNELMRFF